MRILDSNSDQSLENVTLYLTKTEAQQLRSYIDELLLSRISADHAHLNDGDCQRELTVTIYSEGDLSGYDSRSVKLIRTGT